MNHSPRQRGFTLLEVLIALAIVAMSVGALLGTITSSASNIIYLKDKTLAEWVALNRLTEVRIDQDMPTKGKRTGNTVMAGMRWEWQEEVVELPIKGMFRVEVRAHATGELVDDTRAVDKPSAQTLSPARSSGSSKTRSRGRHPPSGVVGSAFGRARGGGGAVRRHAAVGSADRQSGQHPRPSEIRSAIPVIRARGFTLIEVVIAMFIAAIMFAIGYGAINQALRDRDALNVSQERVTEIQLGMRVVAQDFAQAVARPARDTSGGQLMPAIRRADRRRPRDGRGRRLRAGCDPVARARRPVPDPPRRHRPTGFVEEVAHA
jgi:general secretion pathway protein I